MQSTQFNNELDCSICYQQTNGLKLNYHEYMRMQVLWFNEMQTSKQPLVKCIKCNHYYCNNCAHKVKICAFKCWELTEQPTLLHDLPNYFNFGHLRHLDYSQMGNFNIWLVQSIYEHQEDPIKNSLNPCTLAQLEDSYQKTVQEYNNIIFNVQEQTVESKVFMPFQEEPIHVKYQVSLIIGKTRQYVLKTASELKVLLIAKVKAIIDAVFNKCKSPLNYKEIMKFPAINSSNLIFQQKDKTLIEFGYTEFIQRTLIEHPSMRGISKYQLPIHINQVDCCPYITLQECNRTTFFVLQMDQKKMRLDETGNKIPLQELKNDMQTATSAQFIEFFKDV